MAHLENRFPLYDSSDWATEKQLKEKCDDGGGTNPSDPDSPIATWTWFSPKMTSNVSPLPFIATASSDEPSYGSGGAYAAFDGNIDTFWGNTSTDSDRWLEINFGEVKSLYGIRLTARNDAACMQLPVSFKISASLDGVSYTTVLSEMDLPPVTKPAEQREFLFDEIISTRYIKIKDMIGTSQYGPNYCAIGDVSFYIKVESEPGNNPSAGLTVEQVNQMIQDALADYTPMMVYSEQEHLVGTWYNGKPLYSRTLHGTIEAAITGKIYSLKMDMNGKELCYSFGALHPDSHNNPGYGIPASDLSIFVITQGVLAIEDFNSTPRIFIGQSYDITVFYTKTTD